MQHSIVSNAALRSLLQQHHTLVFVNAPDYIVVHMQECCLSATVLLVG